jgi:hypothetical protein
MRNKGLRKRGQGELEGEDKDEERGKDRDKEEGEDREEEKERTGVRKKMTVC